MGDLECCTQGEDEPLAALVNAMAQLYARAAPEIAEQMKVDRVILKIHPRFQMVVVG